MGLKGRVDDPSVQNATQSLERAILRSPVALGAEAQLACRSARPTATKGWFPGCVCNHLNHLPRRCHMVCGDRQPAGQPHVHWGGRVTEYQHVSVVPVHHLSTKGKEPFEIPITNKLGLAVFSIVALRVKSKSCRALPPPQTRCPTTRPRTVRTPTPPPPPSS